MKPVWYLNDIMMCYMLVAVSGMKHPNKTLPELLFGTSEVSDWIKRLEYYMDGRNDMKYLAHGFLAHSFVLLLWIDSKCTPRLICVLEYNKILARKKIKRVNLLRREGITAAVCFIHDFCILYGLLILSTWTRLVNVDLIGRRYAWLQTINHQF